jgi:hypothetical protein
MRCSLLLLALAAFVAVEPAFADAPAPAPAPATPGGPTTATGQARLAAGDVAYMAGDFARAATEYAAGYAAEGWSGFLFAQAQAQRRRGDCPSALALYDRFLATAPDQRAEQMTRDGIAACGGSSTGTASRVSPHAHPGRDDTSLEKIELPPPPPRDTPFPHTLAVILVGSGLAASGVGIVYAVRAGDDADAAKRQATHPETLALYERAQDRTTVARITGGVGAALVIAGVVRFVLHRPARESSTAVVLVPGGFGVAGRF